MGEHVPAGNIVPLTERNINTVLCYVTPSIHLSPLYNAVLGASAAPHFLHYFYISPAFRSVLSVYRPEVSCDKMKTDTSAVQCLNFTRLAQKSLNVVNLRNVYVPKFTRSWNFGKLSGGINFA